MKILIILLILVSTFLFSNGLTLEDKKLNPRSICFDSAFDENEAVYCNCTQNGVIALTFDDGPFNDRTNAVLDMLKEHGVPATFFIQGAGYSHLDDPEAQEVLKRTVNEGHLIASHTWNHPYLTNQTEAEIIDQMKRISDKIYEILGFRPTIMRPPYGHYNDTVIDIVWGQLGYKIIMWGIDTWDWQHVGDINASLEYYYEALNGTIPSETQGFISLHHDPLFKSAELASAVIQYARSIGYRFVTLEECLGIELK